MLEETKEDGERKTRFNLKSKDEVSMSSTPRQNFLTKRKDGGWIAQTMLGYAMFAPFVNRDVDRRPRANTLSFFSVCLSVLLMKTL